LRMAALAQSITQRVDDILAAVAGVFIELRNRVRNCRAYLRRLNQQLLVEDLQYARREVERCSDLIDNEIGHARTAINTMMTLHPAMRRENNQQEDNQ
jgi:hypothetical protein